MAPTRILPMLGRSPPERTKLARCRPFRVISADTVAERCLLSIMLMGQPDFLFSGGLVCTNHKLHPLSSLAKAFQPMSCKRSQAPSARRRRRAKGSGKANMTTSYRRRSLFGPVTSAPPSPVSTLLGGRWEIMISRIPCGKVSIEIRGNGGGQNESED